MLGLNSNKDQTKLIKINSNCVSVRAHTRVCARTCLP